MKTRIIAGKHERNILMYLDRYLDIGDLDHEDLVIIDIHTVEQEDQQMTDRVGLKIAKEWAAIDGMYVILIGYEPESILMKDEVFAALNALENVGFVDLSEPLLIPQMYRMLTAGLKRDDPTCKALFTFKQRKAKIEILYRDSIFFRSDPHEAEFWLEQAKSLGFTGTEAEILKQVQNWRPDMANEFDGLTLSGIFVEDHGTLFKINWEFVPEVKATIERLAAELNKFTYVLTDEDELLTCLRLDHNSVRWPVISKAEIKGATLEIIVDNLFSEQSLSVHRIKAGQRLTLSQLHS